MTTNSYVSGSPITMSSPFSFIYPFTVLEPPNIMTGLGKMTVRDCGGIYFFFIFLASFCQNINIQNVL